MNQTAQLEMKTQSNQPWKTDEKVYVKQHMNVDSTLMARRLGRTSNGIDYAKHMIRNNKWVVNDKSLFVPTNKRTKKKVNTNNNSHTEQSFELKSFSNATSDIDNLKITLTKVVGDNTQQLNQINNRIIVLEKVIKELDSSLELDHESLQDSMEKLRGRINLLNVNANQIKSDLSLMDKWYNTVMSNQERYKPLRLIIWDKIKSWMS